MRYQSRGKGFVETPYGRLLLWEKPLAGFFYTVGADIASGKEVKVREKDSSAATVIRRPIRDESLGMLGQLESGQILGNIHKAVIVCQWHGVTDLDLFAGILADLGYWYNWAWVNPENTGMGIGVVDPLKRIYPRISRERTFKKRDRSEGLTDNLGFNTTGGRSVLLGEYIKAVREDLIDVPSELSLSEYRTFINNNGKLEAAEGKHDDVVFADALAWFCHLREPYSAPGGVERKSTGSPAYRPSSAMTGY